jgi:hypothetical protein
LILVIPAGGRNLLLLAASTPAGEIRFLTGVHRFGMTRVEDMGLGILNSKEQ